MAPNVVIRSAALSAEVSYREASDLMDATAELTDTGKRNHRSEQRRIAMLGTDVLVDAKPWRLVRLKSAAAAQWWGMGTRWCTASRSGGAFDAYVAKGDLFVLVTPEGRFQLSAAEGEFRDAGDSSATLADVLYGAPSDLRNAIAVVVRSPGSTLGGRIE